MALRRLLRSLPLTLAGLCLLGLCVPVATGHWDPAWLRVQKPRVRNDAGVIGLPDVQAPFHAEQRDAMGQLLWRLAGDRVVSRSLYEHDLVSPRLRLFQGGTPWGSVKAAQGEVSVPRGDDPWVEIELTGGVTIEQGAWRAECRRLKLRMHRDGPEAGGGIQLESKDPVLVTASLGEARWQAQAPWFEATLGPLNVRLGAPTKVSGGPVLASQWTGGRTLTGVAHGGVRLRGQGQGDDPTTPPAQLSLRMRDLELDLAKDAGHLEFGSLRARWQRLPTTARALLGGTAGVHPGPVLWLGDHCYALRQVEVDGGLEAALTREATPDRAALAVALSADHLLYQAVGARAQLEGSPARLAEQTAGGWVEAGALELALAAGQAALVARGEVRWGFREPAPQNDGPSWEGWADTLSLETTRPDRSAGRSWEARDLESLVAAGRDGKPVELKRADGVGWLRAGELRYATDDAYGELRVTGGFGAELPAERVDRFPWQAAGEEAHLRVRRQALARRDDGTAPAWDEVLEAAHLSGDPATVGRATDQTRRRRGLSAARIDYAEGVATAEGLAWAQAGICDLRSEALRYTTADGVLLSEGPIQLRLERAGRSGPEVYQVSGGRARAVLTPDPDDWETSRLQRRSTRRLGLRLVPPPVLRELEVDGGVHLQGPRQLDVQAQRLTVVGDFGELLPAPGERVQASWDEGQLEAGVVSVWHRATWPRPRFLLGARDGVRATLRRGVSASGTPAPPVELEAGWWVVDMFEPELKGLSGLEREAATRKAVLGYGAGGPTGVTLRSQNADEQALGAWAARLVGDGSHAVLEGNEQAPLSVTRGSLVLRAPRAEAQVVDDEARSLDLRLSEGWSGVLPLSTAEGGEAEGGRLALRIDLEALRSGRRDLESDEDLIRRLLESAEAEGGLSLTGDKLRLRAQGATLERESGRFRVRGDPAVISRQTGDGWVTSQGRELILRLGSPP